jgi:hypothetical protein
VAVKRKQITLDDWKQVLDDAERVFKLPDPKVTLKDILKEDGASKCFWQQRDSVLRLTGTDIKPVLARSLQIIPMLPERDPQEPERVRRSARRNSQGLNPRMRRLADELERLWTEEWERRQAYVKGSGKRGEYAELPELLRRCADFREEMYAHTRLIHTTHRNPQLRMAQYVGNFFLIVIGKRPYPDLALLFDAAFCAAKKPVPKWADSSRLKIEYTRRARRWQPYFSPTALS